MLKHDLYLASTSRRRIELLKSKGIPINQVDPEITEIIDSNLNPLENAKKLAMDKARAVKKKIDKNDIIILAADTIIVYNNIIFGKPKNTEQAKKFLITFNNDWHKVITGICIICPIENIESTIAAETCVRFRKLSENIIDYYLNTNSVIDKAGAYGIQDFASIFVDRIEGCFYNIVGLPLSKIFQTLEELHLVEI